MAECDPDFAGEARGGRGGRLSVRPPTGGFQPTRSARRPVQRTTVSRRPGRPARMRRRPRRGTRDRRIGRVGSSAGSVRDGLRRLWLGFGLRARPWAGTGRAAATRSPVPTPRARAGANRGGHLRVLGRVGPLQRRASRGAGGVFHGGRGRGGGPRVDLPEGALPNGAGLKFSSDPATLGQNERAAAVIWQWQAVSPTRSSGRRRMRRGRSASCRWGGDVRGSSRI